MRSSRRNPLIASPPTESVDGWIHHRLSRARRPGAGQRIVEFVSRTGNPCRDGMGMLQALPTPALGIASRKKRAGCAGQILGQGAQTKDQPVKLRAEPGRSGRSPRSYVPTLLRASMNHRIYMDQGLALLLKVRRSALQKYLKPADSQKPSLSRLDRLCALLALSSGGRESSGDTRGHASWRYMSHCPQKSLPSSRQFLGVLAHNEHFME